MYLISGETYLLRKQIKFFGYKWDKENNGWIGNNYPEELDLFITENNLLIEEIEDKELPEMTKLDYNIAYAKKRLEKWGNKQNKKELESQSTKLSNQERDFLRLAEPVKVGHYSEKRHRKLLEKVERDWERRGQAYKEAEEAEDKKEYWIEELKILEAKKAGTWKNAKERKENLIQEIKKDLKVGDFVKTAWGSGIILKINKKTVKIDGISWNIDINFLR